MIEQLVAQIGDLEEPLRQNSQNSSRPPSSDAPAGRRPEKRAPSGRKPGGQPGHEGHQRLLLPEEEEVDAIVPVKPRRCRRCGTGLHGTDAAPRRHQVTELPRVRSQITEYQLHTLSCPRCAHRTPAPLPAGVPEGTFGPRVEATVGDGQRLAVCTGVYHLSRRTTVRRERRQRAWPERAIRPAVLWRRRSFGTHSAAGSRFAERLLTVAATLNQQGRNIVDYMTAAYEASLRGKSAPSLLPSVPVTA